MPKKDQKKNDKNPNPKFTTRMKKFPKSSKIIKRIKKKTSNPKNKKKRRKKTRKELNLRAKNSNIPQVEIIFPKVTKNNILTREEATLSEKEIDRFMKMIQVHKKLYRITKKKKFSNIRT